MPILILLYYRPASEFVARFVGKVNLVPCRVVALDAAGARIEILGRRAVQSIPVKVILVAAALSQGEKLLGCRLASEVGVAFVKTSTGFHPAGGATVADVRLLRAAVGPTMGVNASGGIRNLDDARAMLAAGANRIGTSASAAILAALF